MIGRGANYYGSNFYANTYDYNFWFSQMEPGMCGYLESLCIMESAIHHQYVNYWITPTFWNIIISSRKPSRSQSLGRQASALLNHYLVLINDLNDFPVLFWASCWPDTLVLVNAAFPLDSTLEQKALERPGG